ncbi:hypothetical protein HDU78_001378 [Chytriomyces hyalinus]|nr:hypothetical protein HDU78_001378 [Chytriomyces hyalinus]
MEGATTLTTSQCTVFGSSCEAAARNGKTGCNGSWSFRCFPSVASADPNANYPTGICARCLCNGATALIADLPCVTLPNSVNASATAVVGVSGGGSGAVSSSSSVSSIPPSASSIQSVAPSSAFSPNGNATNPIHGNGPPPNSDGSPSYAVPLYITLTLLAVLSASVAVYFYMKRKASIKKERYGLTTLPRNISTGSTAKVDGIPDTESALAFSSRTPSPHMETPSSANNISSSLPRKGAFLRSMWTTTTTTTTSKPGKESTTTTVTISGAFPAAKTPATAASISSVPETSTALTVNAVHTPYLPSDSFLTPASNNAAIGANPNWTLEEQWQWEQYQAAVQWHQWQLKQKEWQAQQREYYLAKEEERKRSALALTESEHGSTAAATAAAAAIPIPTPPNATGKGRRGTLTLGGGGPGANHRPSPLRFVVSGDTDSILSRTSSFKRGSSIMDPTGVGSPTVNRRVSFDLTSMNGTVGPDMNFLSSISRSSTVRSKSVKSSGGRSSMIVATSPEWSAPTDLVRVGSHGSDGSVLSKRETISSKIDGMRQSGVFGDVGATSGTNEDGSTRTVLTSTTFALGDDVSVLTLTSIGEDGMPVTTQILSATGSSGRVGSFDDGYSVVDAGPRLTSINGSLLDGEMGANIFTEPDDGDAEGDVDDDLQVKYQVLKAHVPLKDDELFLEVGDEVVVWQILEDGICEGYNVGKRERGYFPVRVILV